MGAYALSFRMGLSSSFVKLLCTSTFFCLAKAIDTFEQQCSSFKPQTYIHNSTLQILEYVPAGTNLTFSYNVDSCNRGSQVVSVDICRIALTIPTSNRSSITYEQWLPRNWTGRFLATGNGGIDGCLKYEDVAYGAANGFATVGSNNGHNGTRGIAFYHNPEIVKDFAWRAVHTEVVSGKLLLQNFYNKTQSHAYYIGCSLGGRQGFKAAEMFPDDFDGILAGCPALDFNNLISWRASFYPITGPIGSPDFISNETWINLIHNEVLTQCDGLDGVMDGIIQDPNLCIFRPEAIMCPAGQNASTSCLSPTQVEMVRKIFSPLYGMNGNLIYPAMQPGSEIMAVQKLYAGKPFSYSEDWFKYVVLDDPSWNASTFNIIDAALAEALNPDNVRTWPTTQLEPFFRISDKTANHPAGRKLITYHGGQDNQITSFDTERFYDYLQTTMQASSTEVDSYFRFFRIPGMFHCSSGPGAWVLGQGGSSSSNGLAFDPKTNVLAALVAWVENGVAPETIGGTKFVDDDVSKGIQYTRQHCRYPRRSTYTGGNTTMETSWECLGGTSA